MYACMHLCSKFRVCYLMLRMATKSSWFQIVQVGNLFSEMMETKEAYSLGQNTILAFVLFFIHRTYRINMLTIEYRSSFVGGFSMYACTILLA